MQENEENVSTRAADWSGAWPVYECRGWLADGSRDTEQYAWRLTMTCYLAVMMLLAATALPFYAGVPYARSFTLPLARLISPPKGEVWFLGLGG